MNVNNTLNRVAILFSTKLEFIYFKNKNSRYKYGITKEKQNQQTEFPENKLLHRQKYAQLAEDNRKRKLNLMMIPEVKIYPPTVFTKQPF